MGAVTARLGEVKGVLVRVTHHGGVCVWAGLGVVHAVAAAFRGGGGASTSGASQETCGGAHGLFRVPATKQHTHT